MSAIWRFCYESLTVISSVPEKNVRCREGSAIKDVCYKEVSLYGTLFRRQLVHVSKRTTEPIVRCYCAWLRRFCIVNLTSGCIEFKSCQNISTRRNNMCVCNVYTRASTRLSPIQIRKFSSSLFQWGCSVMMLSFKWYGSHWKVRIE